ncbi:sugar ABC transporter substrate-binding protein [Nakamurella flava]|uniref:Sugar ABC transporter substrate-binding protein n=1 Tax=Nakamurella flava TaxID=2576308 RepID=A0A4U6QMX6_9ACTN|nr:substrate-binding domain-containing protein [Nakamurella flava]TKV61739.1 sugar ABC transporter substrate-binding protein [Nakamurella flava]
MAIRSKLVGLTAVAAAAAVVLTGCSSTGGAQTQSSTATAGSGTGSAGTGGGAVADTPRLTIAMVTHETPGDTFWDKIRSGAEAAAAKDNVDLKYSNDPQAAGQSTLIQNNVDAKVDGIATTLVTPDALAGAVKAATDAKIPVVGFNSGIDQYKQLGALMYFGSDETLAGQTVGQKLVDNGAKKTLCVIQAEGSVALEARCAGVKDKDSSTENLQVNGADIASVQSTIQAKLQQDPSIDSIVTLGAPIALAAIQSAKDAGSSAKVVTFDLNADVAKAVKDGTISFSVDQQPYLQGYLAVDSLWLYLTNGNTIGGGEPTLTGPAIVDSSNIDAILTYAEAGKR